MSDGAGERETLFQPLPPVSDEAWQERLNDWPEPATAHPDDGHEHRFTCIRCGVDTGAEERLRAALDEAWAEVEAALPDKRWAIFIIGNWEDGWEAEYSGKSGVVKTNKSGWFHDPGDLPSPAAALRALLAALSGGSVDEEGT